MATLLAAIRNLELPNSFKASFLQEKDKQTLDNFINIIQNNYNILDTLVTLENNMYKNYKKYTKTRGEIRNKLLACLKILYENIERIRTWFLGVATEYLIGFMGKKEFLLKRVNLDEFIESMVGVKFSRKGELRLCANITKKAIVEIKRSEQEDKAMKKVAEKVLNIYNTTLNTLNGINNSKRNNGEEEIDINRGYVFEMAVTMVLSKTDDKSIDLIKQYNDTRKNNLVFYKGGDLLLRDIKTPNDVVALLNSLDIPIEGFQIKTKGATVVNNLGTLLKAYKTLLMSLLDLKKKNNDQQQMRETIRSLFSLNSSEKIDKEANNAMNEAIDNAIKELLKK